MSEFQLPHVETYGFGRVSISHSTYNEYGMTTRNLSIPASMLGTDKLFILLLDTFGYSVAEMIVQNPRFVGLAKELEAKQAAADPFGDYTEVPDDLG